MFVDIATITVKAGAGGNGAVSFHRDKFTASGGPDGGNGGRGGNIIFQADRNLSTLAEFRYKRKYLAENGRDGRSARRTGKNGIDLIVKVPLGTVVRNNADNKIIADLSDFDEVVIAKGGKGGAGNMNFATSVRQSPRFAKAGTKGDELELKLELKLLADVGLVGFPNVGKSTLISAVSRAKPMIANYHFTTLSPVLGVVNYSDDFSFVMADIPGLIEGAWKGLGLGHRFLRHVERCRAIIHVVDVSGSEGRDPVDDFNIINKELENYNKTLAQKPMIVVGNKCDIASEENINRFRDYVGNKGYKFLPISAASHKGIQQVMDSSVQILLKAPSKIIFKSDTAYNDNNDALENDDVIDVTFQDGIYKVKSNKKLDRLVNSVNFNDYDSMQYFQRMLIKYGVISALKEKGAQEGSDVEMCGIEFELFD